MLPTGELQFNQLYRRSLKKMKVHQDLNLCLLDTSWAQLPTELQITYWEHGTFLEGSSLPVKAGTGY